jgi:endonuclease-8
MLARIRTAAEDRRLGEVLQDQSLVAGIGNMWAAEALWRARLSPWLPLRELSEPDRRRALETAATLMRAALAGGRVPGKQVHGRAGRACRRCGTPIRSFGQGDANRTAYWCPTCQPGPAPG